MFAVYNHRSVFVACFSLAPRCHCDEALYELPLIAW